MFGSRFFVHLPVDLPATQEIVGQQCRNIGGHTRNVKFFLLFVSYLDNGTSRIASTVGYDKAQAPAAATSCSSMEPKHDRQQSFEAAKRRRGASAAAVIAPESSTTRPVARAINVIFLAPVLP